MKSPTSFFLVGVLKKRKTKNHTNSWFLDILFLYYFKPIPTLFQDCIMITPLTYSLLTRLKSERVYFADFEFFNKTQNGPWRETRFYVFYFFGFLKSRLDDGHIFQKIIRMVLRFYGFLKTRLDRA